MENGVMEHTLQKHLQILIIKKMLGRMTKLLLHYIAVLELVKVRFLRKEEIFVESKGGYDSNCSSDQTIFILYGECIARAYPLYEVKFRKKGIQI